MKASIKRWRARLSFLRYIRSLASQINSKGQAMVEFTLVFILLLVVAWIPADFGLAFYTGQVAQNAAREGARIAAVDTTLASNSCGPPLSACYGTGNILNETAVRLPAALLTGTTINVVLDADTGINCNRLVTVTVSGNYNFFFYRMLQWFGANIPSNSRQITRFTKMRWEHQAPCPSF